MTRTPRRHLVATLAVVGALTAGCGATVADTGRPSADVSVTDCGEQLSYPTPKQPVAYDVSAIEKMFSLGLADRMRGYVVNALFDGSIDSSPWAADYRKVPRLGTGRISKEIVVDAKADWVMSYWGGGFSEERGITPALLKQIGINSYVQTESCFGYGDRKPVAPMDSVFLDLENLGRIFGVEQKATEVVSGLKARLDKLKAGIPRGTTPARVLVYDSGQDAPYTAGKYASPTGVIEAAGGRNVLDGVENGWTTVGWETVAAANPEVVVVIDYGNESAGDKEAFVKAHPALKGVPAVTQDHFVVLNYGEAVSGPRNVDAAEKLGAYLRSIGK
ncbi:ABC transporter substrate-binding protein [Actinokineospora bangkokensis]|uniref:Iron transporter n=1 Tax=Actinokineospora bangkokensis TaxID=1193682 RepID=A0A1Q9LKJ7_9PSEU|nr:ABC transporter substrate-binding protein [Actinokineospora bangkokensis]OLR92515.1 iron transporter [Actinokineospora bangkokensis]